MFNGFLRDLRFAFRNLSHSPGFALAAVLALALGIGANTTVFSVVQALINLPIPVDDPHRVVLVFANNLPEEITQSPTSVDDFLDWKEACTFLSPLVAGVQRNFHLMAQDQAVRVPGFSVTEGLFEATGARMFRGRTFTAEDSTPGATPVVILSYGLWREHWGGDPGLLGKTILLDKRPHTVIGIAAEGYFFPQRLTQIWTPLTLERGRTPRDLRQILALGRLAEGATIEAAQAELDAVTRRLQSVYPETNENWTAQVVSIRDNLVTNVWMALVVLYSAISFVLLIACANVASLLLARAGVRYREMALRASLGAGRWRLIRQLLTESLVLALAGGLGGLGLGLAGMRLLRNLLAPDPNVGFITDYMHLNTTILGHTLVISVAAALLFGAVPALKISRSDLQSVLKEGGRGHQGSRRPYLRGTLVVTEVALALALLGASGSLIRAFSEIYSADPGFNSSKLLTFQLSLPEEDYSDTQAVEFYRQLRDQLTALPGVSDATLSSVLPLSLFPGTLTARLTPERTRSEDRTNSFNVLHAVVGTRHLETLQTPLLQGRALRESDTADVLPVAVVSRGLAQRFWPDQDPLNRRFKLGFGNRESGWITVVGISDDLQSQIHSLRSPEPPPPTVFLPLAQHPARVASFLLRTEGNPSQLTSAVRTTLQRLDPTLPLENPMSMDESIARTDTQNRFFIQVLSGLAAIAVILAGIGIYGLISYSVNQRRGEIGIRMALGAQPRRILILVVRQALWLFGLGVPIGLGLAYTLVSFMGSQLEGIGTSNASGIGTFIAICLVLAGVAVLATTLPARRAIKLDPVEALRYE